MEPMKPEDQWLNGFTTSKRHSEYLRGVKSDKAARKAARLSFLRVTQLMSRITSRKATRKLRLVEDGKPHNQRLLEELPTQDDV